MEREHWIQKVVNSTNGMTAVAPSEALFSKIQDQIKLQEKVSPRTAWMIAASIAALIIINVAVLNNRKKEHHSTATIYLERTLNQSNQLYQ